MNDQVTSKGGNQYEVNGELVDMDGYTVVSDEDYAKIEKAGLDGGEFIAPMHSDGDRNWKLVAEYCVNYSGLDVDEWIKENK